METMRQVFMPAEGEAQIREAVVREARSWLGTPFRDHARVKGAGVDCVTLLQEVYPAAGVDVGWLRRGGFYPAQWHLHLKKELYLDHLRLVADEMPGPPERVPKPGDVALYRYADASKVFNHAGIVIEWPMIIHTTARLVQWGNADIDAELKDAPRKFFSFWQ